MRYVSVCSGIEAATVAWHPLGWVPLMFAEKLTPRECERLQGFPDCYTMIPGASDSGRYHALGNSMAVPCMAWIGRRIAMVDAI